MLQRKSIFVWKIGPTLISNFLAHRQPTGMVQYSMEMYWCQDFIEFQVNFRGTCELSNTGNTNQVDDVDLLDKIMITKKTYLKMFLMKG